MNDGGPAFPRPAFNNPDDAESFCNMAEQGMSLRDWFAGQFLSGTGLRHDIASVSHSERAEWAYRQADAMLAERAKTQADGR